jgi:hypothetical protein
LGLLDIVDDVLLHKHLHEKGFEVFQGQHGGRPHWCILSFGPHHNYGTAGIVHTLSKEVLAETALLALEHVRNGLEGPVEAPFTTRFFLELSKWASTASWSIRFSLLVM